MTDHGVSRPRPEDDIVPGPDRPRPEDDIVPGPSRPRPEDDPGGRDDKPLLRVLNLSKTYDDIQALDGLSLELYPGDILGFLGPNGAGKTTALRILATIIKPTSGSAEVDGKPLEDIEHTRRKWVTCPTSLAPMTTSP